MSRNTPKRRQNHARQPSGPRIFQASDYESDAAHYLENREGPALPATHFHRTNTELNLGVLRRYVPSISTIVAIAANAVIYTFSAETHQGGWERSGVEGTLFVCSQDANPLTGEPRFCIFVLNRRGLNNLLIELATVRECDKSNEELMMLHMENHDGPEGDGEDKVIGLWMHADSSDARQVNMNTIHGLWEQAKEARRQVQNLHVSDLHDDDETSPPSLRRESSVGAAVRVTGKSLSIGQLFASQGGSGSGGS